MRSSRSSGSPLPTTSLASTTRTSIDLVTAERAALQVVYDDDAPAAVTFDSATLEVQTLTFPAFAAITDGDYIKVEDAAGIKYAVYADKTGATVAPTGAIYLAATHKVKANISADTTAAEVAARFELAFNTLTGFTAAITSNDTAADGTMMFTQVAAGPTTNAIPKDANDGTAGSITAAETTIGRASEIDLTTDYITIPAHGLVTGTKVAATTAGTLPTGVTATNYFVIKIDADTIQLASSLANAEAGTKVNMTVEGDGQHTLTPATSSGNVAKLQESNDGETWTDVASATVTIATTAGSVVWHYSNNCRHIAVLYTPSAGQVILGIHVSLLS